jgi:hypothetical protein
MNLAAFAQSKPLRWFAVGALVTLFLAAGICTYFRISSAHDAVAYFEMSCSFHPVWKDLALRRIALGDSAATLTIRHPPPMTVHYGSFTEYEYEIGPPGTLSFTSLRIAAKDGKLMGAWAASCTWNHTFFEDANQIADREAAYAVASEHSSFRVQIEP